MEPRSLDGQQQEDTLLCDRQRHPNTAHQHGGGGVMIWALIAPEPGNLAVIELTRTLTAEAQLKPVISPKRTVKSTTKRER